MIPKTRFLIIAITIVAITCPTFAQQITEAKPKTYTLSGSVGVGISGVQMTGLPGHPVTTANGDYSVKVPHGWSGIVQPAKEGYTFHPPSMQYDKITADLTNQNYSSSILIFTISGSTGVEGVAMRGLPGDPITDARGNYSATLEFGWVGTVKPEKPGYTFTPATKTYKTVIHDYPNDNYNANIIMLTISGQVIIGGSPIEGIKFTAESDIDGKVIASCTTDDQGKYSLKVPYGWSGKLTPMKDGWLFDPPYTKYHNVTTDMVEGKPEKTLPPAPKIEPTETAKVTIIPTSEVKPQQFAALTEDIRIMLHIFNDQLQDQSDPLSGVFTDFGDYFGQGACPPQAIYIQGYGAIFLTETNIPIIPSPMPMQKDPNQPKEENVDPVWQQAKKRLTPGMYSGMAATSGAQPEVVAKTIDQIKTDVIQTLKHATNIRGIEPNELITVVVTVSSRQTGGMGAMMMGSVGPSRRSRRTGIRSGSYSRSYSGSGYGMGGYGASSGTSNYGDGGSGASGASGGMMGGGMGGYGGGGGAVSGGVTGGTGAMGGGMSGGAGMMGGGMGGGMSSGAGMMGGGMGVGMSGGAGMMGGGMGGMGGGMMGGGMGMPDPATITIRATKSAIDAFAKAEIDFEQFEKSVKVFTY